jgi:flagellar biosynthesis/type III secretory pathway M-ring protein FliF/YscJ
VEKALPVEKPERKMPMLPGNWLRYFLWLVGGAAVIFLVIFIFSKLKKKPAVERNIAGVELPVQKADAPQAGQEKASTLSGIKSAVDKNPEKIAKMLKNWLTE